MKHDNAIIPAIDAISEIVVFINSLNRIIKKQKTMIIRFANTGRKGVVFLNEVQIIEVPSTPEGFTVTQDDAGYDQFLGGLIDAMEKKDDILIQSPGPL